MLSPVIKPTSPVSEFIDFVKDAISKSTQALVSWFLPWFWFLVIIDITYSCDSYL